MGRKKSLRNFLYIILGGILATILYLEYQKLQEGFKAEKPYRIYASVSNDGNTIKIDNKSDDYKKLISMGVRFTPDSNNTKPGPNNSIIIDCSGASSLGNLSNIDVLARNGGNPYSPLKFVDLPHSDVVKFLANNSENNYIRTPPAKGRELITTENEISLKIPKAVGPKPAPIQTISVIGLRGSNINMKKSGKSDIQIILTF